jgi:hypothetical protein
LWGTPAPAAAVRAFGLWLTRDYAEHGVAPPEVFPKQDAISKYGNWYRLPGNHHTRKEHWTKCWDGTRWLEGAAAIDRILGTKAAGPDLIPEEARAYKAPPGVAGRGGGPGEDPPGSYESALRDGAGKHGYARLYGGDLKTLDLLGLFAHRDWLVGDKEDYPALVRCPWHESHTDGREEAYVWQNHDDCDNRGWPRFFCHHQHCAGKALEQVLAFFGPEKVNAACAKAYSPMDGFLAAEDLVNELIGTAAPFDGPATGAASPTPEAAGPAPEAKREGEAAPEGSAAHAEGWTDKYKADARTAYLWRGNHLKYVTEDERRKRVESIEDAWQFMPPAGFVPEYVKHWLPTTDAPVLFHLAGALAVAACLLHRKTHCPHGATVLTPVLWCALLASSSKMRKSTCVDRARDSVPNAYADAVLPAEFTPAAMLQHMGQTCATKEEAAHLLMELEKRLRDDPHDLTGVGFLTVDELGGMLKNLSKDYNAGGKQLLTTLFDGKDYVSATKTKGYVVVPQPFLNVIAATTLAWLSQATQEEDVAGGFYPRWLFFFADQKDYELALPDAPSDGGDFERWRQALADMAPGEKKLSAEAEAFYVDWHKRAIAQADEETAGWLRRLVIYAIKVALIYEATTDNGPEIGLGNVERACRLIQRVAADTAAVLREELAFDAEDALVKAVRKWIKEKKDVSWRDCLGRFHRKAKKALATAIDTLVGQGLLEPAEGERGGKRFRWIG